MNDNTEKLASILKNNFGQSILVCFLCNKYLALQSFHQQPLSSVIKRGKRTSVLLNHSAIRLLLPVTPYDYFSYKYYLVFLSVPFRREVTALPLGPITVDSRETYVPFKKLKWVFANVWVFWESVWVIKWSQDSYSLILKTDMPNWKHTNNPSDFTGNYFA